ncbi:MAG: hypothetical protein OEV14_09135 [Gammaproteobacteria bacterium]|nr:hypothetical protein [Gammaproteobacteria bacterium]
MRNTTVTRLKTSRSGLAAPLAVMLAAGWLAGCTGGVALESSFTPGATRGATFTSFLVVGVSPDVNQRCAFEYSMASSLRSDAVKATASCAVMNTREPLTREGIERVVATVGADAVLATSLVASGATLKEGGSADARGGGYYKATGFGYETGYWGAYGVPVVYGEFQTAPSVFSVSGTVQIQTRLFETRGATLVYSLDTKAKNLESRDMALAEITPAIAERLQKDGLVR